MKIRQLILVDVDLKYLSFKKREKQESTCIFYKKVVYKKVVLNCSKSKERSIIDFWELRKFMYI